jgi:hypothetical protein
VSKLLKNWSYDVQFAEVHADVEGIKGGVLLARLDRTEIRDATRHDADFDPDGARLAVGSLMAAAPDLLAACQEILTQAVWPAPGEEIVVLRREAFEQVAAALARAQEVPHG